MFNWNFKNMWIYGEMKVSDILKLIVFTLNKGWQIKLLQSFVRII